MTGGSVQVFSHNDVGILFRKQDMSLVLVPWERAHAGNITDDTFSSKSVAVEQVFRDDILSPDMHGKCETVQPQTEAPLDSRPSLDRFTLTISNVCNLGCSYCYASGGTYYNVDGLMMTRETAMNAINQAARVYSRIEHINFFGGEPTLNPDIIEVICEYVRYLHQRGVLSHLPTFGITTNGYAIDDRMVEILTAYKFSVTLSLDGPETIHDFKRPTKAGKGSYEAIARNAKRLLQNGIEIEFECTYTADHLKNGFDLVSLMDFFYDEFGCRTLHSPVVSAAPDSPEFIPFDTCLQLQGDAIEYSILNLARGISKTHSLAVRLLNSLRNKTPIWNYCPAGKKEVTVNADGNVYACFMLMQRDGYSFGNVNGADSQPKPRRSLKVLGQSDGVGKEKHVIERFIEDADKYTNEACKKCWAQPLCHGCMGEDFERHGGSVNRSEIPGVSEFCDYKRGIIERFFHSLASAYEIGMQTNV